MGTSYVGGKILMGGANEGQDWFLPYESPRFRSRLGLIA